MGSAVKTFVGSSLKVKNGVKLIDFLKQL